MSKTEHERLSEKATAKTRDARTPDEHHDAAEAHQQAAQAKGRAGRGVEAAKHSSEAIYHRKKAAQPKAVAAQPAPLTERQIEAHARLQRQEGVGKLPMANELEHNLRAEKALKASAAAETVDLHHEAARLHAEAATSKRIAGLQVEASNHERTSAMHKKVAKSMEAAPAAEPVAHRMTAPGSRGAAQPARIAAPAHLEHTAAKSPSAAGSDAARLDKEIKIAKVNKAVLVRSAPKQYASAVAAGATLKHQKKHVAFAKTQLLQQQQMTPSKDKLAARREAMTEREIKRAVRGHTQNLGEARRKAQRGRDLSGPVRGHLAPVPTVQAAPMKTSKVPQSKLRPVSKVQEIAKTKAAVAVKQVAALKAQPAGRSRAGGPALYFKEGYGTKYPTAPLQKGKKGGTFLLINGNKYYVGKK